MLLDLYVNSIIKIALKKNYETPYIYGDIIAYLKYDNAIKSYVLNHPYNIETHKCNCGEAVFNNSDIKFIKTANDEEKKLWAKEYIKFHNDWVKYKGYDNCELDLSFDEILGIVNLEMK